MLDWPQLLGTPEQIAWAETIRQRQAEAFVASLDRATRRWGVKAQSLATDIVVRKLRAVGELILRESDSAEWWIERRDVAFDDVVMADPRFLRAIDGPDP